MKSFLDYDNYGQIMSEVTPELPFNSQTKLYEVCTPFTKLKYEKSFTDLKYGKPHCDCPKGLKKDEWLYLYEGLVKSASIEQTYKRLIQYNGLILELCPEGIGLFNKTPFLSFYMPNKYYYNNDTKNEDYEEVQDLKICFYRDIDNLGWFVAVDDEDTNILNNRRYIAIHPKFIIEVTDQVYQRFKGILYHCTPTKNMNKINANGLIPRNSYTYEKYPDRVYFYATSNPNMIVNHLQEHMKKFKDEKKKQLDKAIDDYQKKLISEETFKYICNNRYDYRDFTILKVDVKNKKHYKENDITTHYKFYDDPKSSGVFTYENIDPLCISVFTNVTLQDTDDFEYVLNYI